MPTGGRKRWKRESPVVSRQYAQAGQWGIGGCGSLAKFIDRKPIKIAALKPTPWRRSKMEITWVGTTKIETSKSGGRMAETPVG